jgi:hypothetical protein
MRISRPLLIGALLVASACAGNAPKTTIKATSATPSPSVAAESSPSPAPEPSPVPSPSPTMTVAAPVPSPTKLVAKPIAKPTPSPTPAATPSPSPTAASFGGSHGTWGCGLEVQSDLRRNFNCSGMTPVGQSTWTCKEQQPNTWACTGETGLGQGSWTWTLRDVTRNTWDGTPPTQLAKRRSMYCGGDLAAYLLRCTYYPTGEAPSATIDYRNAGDVNAPKATARGDAGFGAATWTCELSGSNVNCSGQVGWTYMTSPLPILYNALHM